MTTDVCRGPGCESRVLIKAHIVPAAFGRRLGENGASITLTDQGARRGAPPLGYFDKDILCAACDGKLGVLDRYAVAFFETYRARRRRPPASLILVDPFRADLLAKFAVAVLWRASISQRREWRAIALGPHEDAARDFIFDPAIRADSDRFEVAAIRLKSAHIPPEVMEKFYTLPSRGRGSGVNGYRFVLGGFKLFVKVDQRPHLGPLAHLRFIAGQPMRTFEMDLEKNPEFQFLKTSVRRELNRRRASPSG